MKLLTLNFLTCAVKACKPQPAAFPLHVRDAELERVTTDYNALLLRNLLPRLDRAALASVAAELGLQVPAGFLDEEAEDDAAMQVERQEDWWRELHTLLLETRVASGTLVCGLCGHEYAIREGIPNFLLPPHLV